MPKLQLHSIKSSPISIQLNTSVKTTQTDKQSTVYRKLRFLAFKIRFYVSLQDIF